MSSTSIVIIGAGLTGCCAALELAQRGHRVRLIEQDDAPMKRASLRNEGKIHLGLIYANDRTLATARLQLRAALRFRPLLERWLGERVRRIAVSTPFDYLVARDSLLGPAQLGEFYAQVDAMYRAEIESDASLNYLGLRPLRLAYALGSGEVPAAFASDLMQGAFRTQERAIDTDDLAVQVREAVADRAVAGDAGIELLTGHQVSGIERTGDEFVITGREHGAAFRVTATHVINASWERRMGIDRMLGIAPRPGALHRLKYRVICRTPAALADCPSITIVLGRYGDVVIRPSGTAYLSWYPAGLQGWAPGVEPPRDWDSPCRGEPAAEVAARVAEATVPALAQWVPALAGAEVLQVDAGAIVADGETDVDDAASGLHARVKSGVLSQGGYHSVDPGKLTSAPMYALEAAERVDRALRGGAAA
ncbi:MAG: FAD-binding oxidoreductase [Phycisphaerales bacterium]|nr:FAD-binding oxidoreductase [Phycisphaerales bacterium]